LSDQILHALALGQGIYFFVTGIWPILHVRSFMRVTGPKRDIWLVKTVGAVISVIGITLLAGGVSGQVGVPVFLLAVLSAAALAAVDVIYVGNGTISKIYLLDAAIEVLLIAAWLIGIARSELFA
jgi:hypothetical protein